MTIQRTELFVPLTTTAPAGESREFRITVIPQADRAGEFQSLEAQADELRNHPMSSDVSQSGSGSQGGASQGGVGQGGVSQGGTDQARWPGPQGRGETIHHQPGKVNFLPGKKNYEPRVLLQRDGERITNIRVQCSCGQVMDLACDYGDPQPVE
jgi:hypothetical protein